MSPRGGEAARPKEYCREVESTRADSHAEQESSNMASKRMKKMAVVQTDMPNDIVASSNNQQKQQSGNRGGESINFMEHHLDERMKEVLVYLEEP